MPLQVVVDLIRRCLRGRRGSKPLPPLEEDPLWKFAGGDPDTEPVDDIDEFLYGPRGDA